jgi:hypothetical protein
MTEPIEIPEAPDEIRGRVIGWSLFGAVATIALCTLVVWLARARVFSGGGRSDLESLSIVPPAQPFEAPTELENIRAAQRVELDRTMWLDAAHTRVRLSARAAIEHYLEQRGRK